MPAESYDDDEDEIEGPKSSFGTYLAEGDALFKQSEFKKALESYSLALELEPEDKNCLVARSKCYLKLGDPQKALQDAEAALVEDKEFNRGLYRKAEALYCMGDFEYALMYYHRGHNLRPELDEFRLGIQKAQEAIDNSIGSAAKVKLENKGDLSFFSRQDDIGSKKRGYTKPTRNLKLKPVIVNRNKETKPPAPSKKTVKQLLGELYADKEYMEKLMEDEGFIQSHSNKPVYELVQSGLAYLDTRTEFWRQQRPLYARKKETGKSSPKKKKSTKQSIGKQVLKQLEEIDQALANGDPERSLKLAQTLMKTVEDADPASLPNKNDVIANVHSCIGNAFVEMENLNKALKHHQKDLEISKKSKSQEGISRGLDNVGRVYARMGDYERAVRSWNEKLPMVKTPLETTWIYHEIGRCYLELNKHQKAKDCGLKSLKAAEEFEDEVWQLNASVLVAQSQVKLGHLDEGLEKFEQARTIAISLDDEAAQNAIDKAISDLKVKMDESQGTTTATDQETTSDNDATSDNEATEEDDRLKQTDDSETEAKSDDEDETETEQEEKKKVSSESETDKKEVTSESDAEKVTDAEDEEDKYEDDYEEDTKTDDEDETTKSDNEDETTKSDNENDSASNTAEDAPTDSLLSPRDKTDDTDTEDKTTTILSDTDEDTTTQKISDLTSSDHVDDKSVEDTEEDSNTKTDTETTQTKTITDNDDEKSVEDDTLGDVTPQNSDTEADDEKLEKKEKDEKAPSPVGKVNENETGGGSQKSPSPLQETINSNDLEGHKNEKSPSPVHEATNNDKKDDVDEKSSSPVQVEAEKNELIDDKNQKSPSPVQPTMKSNEEEEDEKSSSPVQVTNETTDEKDRESPLLTKASTESNEKYSDENRKSPLIETTENVKTTADEDDKSPSTVQETVNDEMTTDKEGKDGDQQSSPIQGANEEGGSNDESIDKSSENDGTKNVEQDEENLKEEREDEKKSDEDEKLDDIIPEDNQTNQIDSAINDISIENNNDKNTDDVNEKQEKDTSPLGTSETNNNGTIEGDKENDPAIKNDVIDNKIDVNQDIVDKIQEADSIEGEGVKAEEESNAPAMNDGGVESGENVPEISERNGLESGKESELATSDSGDKGKADDKNDLNSNDVGEKSAVVKDNDS